MSTRIGKVAYVATWDASQLTKGIMTSKQLFNAQKKILEASRSPLEKYVDGLTNLQNIVARYPEVSKQKLKLEHDLERQYLKEAKAIRVLSKEESDRLKHLTRDERASGKTSDRNARIKALAEAEKAARRKRGLEEQADQQRERESVANHQKALLQRLQSFKERKRQMEKESLAMEKAMNQARIAELKRVGQAEKNLDRKRQIEEEQNVRAARKALHQRLEDRRKFVAQQRQLLRQSVSHVREHAKTYVDLQGKGSGAAGSGFSLGSLSMGALKRAAPIAAPAAAVAALRAIDNSSFANLNRELERTESAFTVFTGSLQGSANMIADIRDLSAQTGVSFNAFTQGARTMMQFGVPAEGITKKMREIAIVTGGNAERMQSMSLAMAQVSAAGKLMGQELIQLVNAGWSPFEEIGKRLNKTIPELRKEMEAGNISYEMVADALTSATEAGGRYYGFLEALEGTSARMADKSNAAWEETSAKIGEAIEPITNFYNRLKLAAAVELGGIASYFNDIADAASVGLLTLGLVEGKTKEIAKNVKDVASVGGFNKAAEQMKAQEELRKQEKEFGMAGLDAMRMSAISNLFPEEDVARFEKVISLLDESKRAELASDFLLSGGDLESVLGWLDKEVRLELEKVEALEKQGELYQKRLKLMAESRQLGDSIDSQMQGPLTNRLAELLIARQMGGISDDQFAFARDKAVKESASNRSGPSNVSIQKGTQEAYQFVVGIQDRNLKMQLAKEQEQINLQKALLEAQIIANGHLAEIADVEFGSDG